MLKILNELAHHQTILTAPPRAGHRLFPVNVPVPTHEYLVISLVFAREHSKKSEYRVYEVFRHYASGNGGYLSFPQIKELSIILGAKYKTLLAYLRRCKKHGWIVPEDNGYLWRSEELLHKEILDKPANVHLRNRLGRFPLIIQQSDLVTFLNKGVKDFNRHIVIHGDLMEVAKTQEGILKSTSHMIDKIKGGGKVRKKTVSLRDKTTSYQDVPISVLEQRFQHYKSHRIGLPASNRDDVSANPSSVSTQCSYKSGTLRGVTVEGEELYTVFGDNVCSVWSNTPITAADLKFDHAHQSKAPKGFDPEHMIRTDVREADISLSYLSRLNNRSASTNARYLRAEVPDLIVRKEILVCGAYSRDLVADLNSHNKHDKFNLPIRGRYFAVRMSRFKALNLQKKGYHVVWKNQNGPVEALYQEPFLTVLVFQHRYFVIDRVKKAKVGVSVPVSEKFHSPIIA